ncbi:MAG: sterol desaturase family protein [Alteraurantiacibacter sp.]
MTMKPTDENAQRMPLFENSILEKLTVISATWFIVTWAILLPLIAVIGWGAAEPVQGFALVCAGLLVWTLFEYVAHRYVFHWEPRSDLLKRLVFVIHTNHHLEPNDRLRNLMPPVVSIPVAACIWALFYAVGGAAATWAFLGFMIGYTGYDLTHYACHQWKMQGRLGKAMKRHHMRHHFTQEPGNYAITAIFWDQVLGSSVGAKQRKHTSNPMRSAD